MPIRFPRSQLYPLPPDYDDLDREGRRLARVNAIQLRETPEDDVLSWLCFREWYLKPEEANWYEDWKEPAKEHLEWTRICATYDRAVIGAHRGSAKSTIFSGEYTLRDLVSIPRSSTLLVNIGLKKIKKRFDGLMRQIETNPLIIQDFGKLRPPPRSAGIWAHDCLILSNGASLTGVSVKSRDIRGERPRRIIVDDPEFDPAENTDLDRLIAELETLLFQVLLPMLRAGSKLHWIGTPISCRSFIWRLLSNEIRDPRLDPEKWFRKIYPGEDPSTGYVFWPEENTPDELARKKLEFGDRYGPEFLCQPRVSALAPFRITPKILYGVVGGEDPTAEVNPLMSKATIKYEDETWPARELYGKMMRVICLDACRKPSPQSDWAVIHVMGLDARHNLWSLDLWAGKVMYGPLTDILWEYVKKWKVKAIGVESVAMEQHLLAAIHEQLPKFTALTGSCPVIKGITYPHGVKKEDRIQTLSGRFQNGSVRLPEWLRYTFPYSMLFSQIEGFSPSGTTLEHDDAIDTLAMGHLDMFRNAAIPVHVEQNPNDVFAMLRRGQLSVNGVPLLVGLPLDRVPSDIIQRCLARKMYPEDERRVELLRNP